VNLVGRQDLAISVHPAGLATTGHQGTVTFTGGGFTATLNVVLDVRQTGSPVLRITPSSYHQTLDRSPTPQNVSLQVASSNNSTVTYSVDVPVISPATTWITAASNTGQPFGTSGAPATAFITTSALPTDATTGMALIRFVAANGSIVTVPVSVVVNPAATLVASPAIVTFAYAPGTPTPASKPVAVNSSSPGQSVSYTAQVFGSWIAISTNPSDLVGQPILNLSTPSTFYVIVNPAAVGSVIGTYEGRISLTSLSGGIQDVTVRMTISNSPLLRTTPDAINFAHQVGGPAPDTQQLSVQSSTSTQLDFTVTVAPGAPWLRVSAPVGRTPTSISIGVDPASLAALAEGTYNGRVILTSPQAPSTLEIPVTLRVSGSTALLASPMSLTFEGAQGQELPQKTITLTAADGSNLGYSIAIEGDDPSWLLAPTSGFTGPSGSTLVPIGVNPAFLTPGRYEARLRFTPTGTQNTTPLRIPVTYVVTSTASLSATPNRLEVTQTGTTPPSQQTISISSNISGLTFVAAANQPWIRLSQTSGTLPTTLNVTFESVSLVPGNTYNGTITVQSSTPQTIQIPVVLTVQPATQLGVSPTALTFTHALGAQLPATQTLSLTSSGAAITYTASPSTQSGGNWLQIVSGASGSTNAAGGAGVPVQIRVDPSGLTPGEFLGQIRFSSGAITNLATVPVTLRVTAPSAPVITSFVNAASSISRGVSPGDIVTVMGRNMAPPTATPGQVQNGRVTTQTGGVTVYFNGVAAPLLYAGPSGDRSSDQINLVVPYGVAGLTSANMIVEYNGIRSEARSVTVVETDPGVFTSNAMGSGQAAALNQDGTINSTSNPARVGSTITLFATGEGVVAPAVVDGAVISSIEDIRRPLANVAVRIGGQLAQISYYGSAGGAVSGAFQLNVVVPQFPTLGGVGELPVDLHIGGNASQPGVTIAVAP
jgi:uncharacterized protein (TIGR03437 family)